MFLKKLNSPETGAALFNNPTSSSNSDANTDEGNLIPVLLKKKLHSCEASWENTAQPLYWAEKHPSQIHSHSVSGCDHTWNKVSAVYSLGNNATCSLLWNITVETLGTLTVDQQSVLMVLMNGSGHSCGD